MIGKTKSVIIALCAGAFVMGTAGCTASAGPAEPSSSPPTASISTPSTSSTPTAKPTPKPVPASSKGPAQNWPVPKMPEAAKKKSEEGIVAFTKYYFELVDYTVLTYDTKPIKSVTEHSCYLCAKQLIDPGDRNRGKGSWHVGGKTTLKVNFAKEVDSGGVSGFTFLRDKTLIYLPSGELQGKIPALTNPAAGTLQMIFADGWKVADVEFIDPDGK
ncbi:DUF6318 family protein [Paeniglutamicibacter sp. NPDC012692]|uniref:DUF6318 family protein n=1 Tax=Paeniglutamicibacter sp. NPDC012692 TaxID=3364388 RepID=UPI003687D33A